MRPKLFTADFEDRKKKMSNNDHQIDLGITDDKIAKRAYELWESRGCPQSDGHDDWKLAERQLFAEARRRQHPIVRLLSRLRKRAAL